MISVTLSGQVKSPVLSGKDKVALLAKQTEMKAASPFKDLKWQYIGPTNISGRCTDVEAVSPRGKSYTIWVGSATGGVWKSTDFGDSWQDISVNIPVGPVNVIREDPVNRDILYAGTDGGVFVSKNGGVKWDILGNLPFSYVHDLAIHPRDNIIIIATHGRGMWVMDANTMNEKGKTRASRRQE